MIVILSCLDDTTLGLGVWAQSDNDYAVVKLYEPEEDQERRARVFRVKHKALPKAKSGGDMTRSMWMNWIRLDNLQKWMYA